MHFIIMMIVRKNLIARLWLGGHWIIRKKSRKFLKKMIKYGGKYLEQKLSVEYFAVSLTDINIWEEELNKRNRFHCHYVIA